MCANSLCWLDSVGENVFKHVKNRANLQTDNGWDDLKADVGPTWFIWQVWTFVFTGADDEETSSECLKYTACSLARMSHGHFSPKWRLQGQVGDQVSLAVFSHLSRPQHCHNRNKFILELTRNHSNGSKLVWTWFQIEYWIQKDWLLETMCCREHMLASTGYRTKTKFWSVSRSIITSFLSVSRSITKQLV